MEHGRAHGLTEPFVATNVATSKLSPVSGIVFQYPVTFLMVTILLECVATISLKCAFRSSSYAVIAIACYSASLGLFSIVLQCIPLSVAYTT